MRRKLERRVLIGVALGSVGCTEIVDAGRFSVAPDPDPGSDPARAADMSKPVDVMPAAPGPAGGSAGPAGMTNGTPSNLSAGGGAAAAEGPAPAQDCASLPTSAGCQQPAAEPLSPQAALAKAAAQNVLLANCGQCHGAGLTPQEAQGGLNYIGDIDALVSAGKIVPLNSAASRIIQRMQRGEMPPVSSGLPPVTAADIAIVAQYIDNPAFWPQVPAPSCEGTTVVNFDQLFQQVNLDLASADVADRPFRRYISLTNRQTAGVCLDALEPDRQALVKMLNMLSTSARIQVPTPVNTDLTLYRIDTRDFDWDRAISVQGVNFNDVWEAIAARNPYAVEFVGDDADDAKIGTTTHFPIMFSDQMLDVATVGQLYYAIIGVDTSQPLASFISNQLQIDLAQDLRDDTAIWGGTTKSRSSRQDRVARRDQITVRSGVLWQAFDIANDANQSIFEEPFTATTAGSEAIFTLPNGMLGFIIADASGTIREDSDLLLDTNQNSFRAITSVSCWNCHQSGFVPLVDEVRSVALQNSAIFDAQTLAQIQAMYVSPDEFARTVAQDSQNFYQRALQLAQLPTDGAEPVSSVFLRFDQLLKLADAAGDLGVTPADLKANLQLLDPALGVLADGTLDRAEFSKRYIDSLCRLSTPLENQPATASCAAAAAAGQ